MRAYAPRAPRPSCVDESNAKSRSLAAATGKLCLMTLSLAGALLVRLYTDIWTSSQKDMSETYQLADGIGTEVVAGIVVALTQPGHRQTAGERVSRSASGNRPWDRTSHHRSKRDGDRSMFVPLRHKPRRLGYLHLL